MSFSPYIFFSGDCAEAFALYGEVFGGEVQVMTHGDLPDDAEPMPGAKSTDVMHASLSLGSTTLMGSDDPTGDGGPKTGVAVSYEAKDIDDARRIFDVLFEGGRVDMPLAATFWSPAFGVGIDRFGVTWMIDCAFPEEG